ncbi:MAG TPA: TetR/AcrR family transcriptional regulator [Pseudonocardiaceae bacterium]|nr:TetR/AcrR family transcriptional regulator [Pseudonocardiaceae bacterium]
MSISERRQRQLAQRAELIVGAARELAEEQGWEAVTTRRLADRVEYSQPVLYSHFAGKDAIVDAVAVTGIAELTGQLRAAVADTPPGRVAVGRLARAYLNFAVEHPAVYQAMFTLTTGLPFATDEAPAALKESFAELSRVLTPAGRELGALTEVFWSALHGIAVLLASGRMRPEHQEERVAIVIDLFG